MVESRYYPGALKENPYIETLIYSVSYHTRVNIYNSLITPYLRYGLTVLVQGSKTYLNKLSFSKNAPFVLFISLIDVITQFLYS